MTRATAMGPPGALLLLLLLLLPAVAAVAPHASGGPVQPHFRDLDCASTTLNAIDQPRVTLSLR